MKDPCHLAWIIRDNRHLLTAVVAVVDCLCVSNNGTSLSEFVLPGNYSDCPAKQGAAADKISSSSNGLMYSFNRFVFYTQCINYNPNITDDLFQNLKFLSTG